MGGVVVLHPQEGYYYNRMPLFPPSPTTNHALKTNSNRRKRSPRKLTNDFTKSSPKRSNFDHNCNASHMKINYLTKSPPKSSNFNGPQKKPSDVSRSPLKISNFDQNVNYSPKKINDLCRSPPKRSNFDVNGKTIDLSRFPQKSLSFDQKVNHESGLPRFPPKCSTNLDNGKISRGNKLVMEKVKILKRGEVLMDYEDTKKKTVFVDKETEYEKENMMVNLENNEVINTVKKMVSFHKETKYEKVVNLENSEVPNTKKKMVLFDKETKYEKVVNLENNEVPNTKKKMVLVDKEKKNKNVFLEKNEDLRLNIDLDSVELLMRSGPEPGILQKHIRLDHLYAGWPFMASPDPSSLPFPPFLKKGTSEIELTQTIDDSNDDDNGSSHLRRLLKLAF